MAGRLSRPFGIHMVATRSKWITFTVGVLLVICSAPLWLMYVANGMHTGALLDCRDEAVT